MIKKCIADNDEFVYVIIRWYSAVSAFFTMLLIMYNLRCVIDNYLTEQKNIPGLLAADIFFLIFILIIFFRPVYWQLLTFSHITTSIFILFFGGDSVLSCLLFMTGWVVAYRFDFFRTKTYSKIGAVSILFICAILSKYLKNDTGTIYNYLVILACIPAVFLIFFVIRNKTDLVRYAKIESAEYSINLAEYDFSQKELYAIAATLRDETYYSIALHLKVSESVVKKMMLEIYSKFGCKNRELFLNKISCARIIYPKWYNPCL